MVDILEVRRLEVTSQLEACSLIPRHENVVKLSLGVEWYVL
jgi:hypothetical protein